MAASSIGHSRKMKGGQTRAIIEFAVKIKK